jgi:hypothetical protein
MGVKLDWDIESEQGKHQEHKEDFKNRSKRYLGIVRLLTIIVIFLACVAGIVYVIYQRWNQVTQRLEGLLTETVQAEVAALRIGDYDSYINLQRSATDAWLVQQNNTYDVYQQLKVSSDVTLTGNVTDVEVDGQRGRVQVEEIIGGAPYVQTWFYWRYPEPDGWRHVPLDKTFWGDAATIENSRFVIRYRTLDERVAAEMAQEVERWLDDACSYLDCSSLPVVTIDIISDFAPEPLWAANEQNAWQMVVSSPYLGRARADRPFDTTLQIDMATLLAERLVDNAMANRGTNYPTDATFLRSATVAWMVGRFVQLNPESHLIESLTANYGTDTISQLLTVLQPTSDMSVLSSVTGVPSLADANLDWRDFVAWRLNTEANLIQIADEANWQTFYDFRDSVGVRDIAYGRYNANAAAPTIQVLDITRGTTGDGSPQLQARVQITDAAGQREEIVLFNLVNNVWRRAS